MSHRMFPDGRGPARPRAGAVRAIAIAGAACAAMLGIPSTHAQGPAPERAAARAQAPSPETRAARHFAALAARPAERLPFLLAMPKGTDLHVHLAGAVYAESLLRWAQEKGLCLNRRTHVLSAPPCDAAAGVPEAAATRGDDVFYRQTIDAWSMRGAAKSRLSGHDQFFDTFAKFSLEVGSVTGPMLAEALARAARGRVSYTELMVTPDDGIAASLGREIGWDGDFAGTLARLEARGIGAAVAKAKQNLRAAEAEKDRLLRCGTPDADAGCTVAFRWIYQAYRAGASGAVYAQMVAGLALADDPDSRTVGVNLVQPEDAPASLANFRLQMEMLRFLRPRYPRAHLSLHAGELAPGLVPPEQLGWHVRDSVAIAGAERIGHGVDVLHDPNAAQVLRDLARRGVLVEICLTSNDAILGVRGPAHPLATYLHYGVPVALSTDDQGVARSSITMEHLKAVNDQGLDYRTLKTMARTGLEHAFVPGASLWADPRRFVRVAACARATPSADEPPPACAEFLAGSEKARLQWALERDYAAFEAQF